MKRKPVPEQPAVDYRPLIIIGAARSGTKVFRDLVAEHPDVDKVPYDVNYIWRIGNEGLGHDELTPDNLNGNARQRIINCLNRYHDGASCLVEKSVGNCLRVGYVGNVFPEARYIHLIRDGQDVVESAFRQWQAPPKWGYILKKASTYPLSEAAGDARSYAVTTFRKVLSGKRTPVATWGPRYDGIDDDFTSRDLVAVCAIQWSRCVSKALADLASLPPERVMTIRYEDFARHPDNQLARVADFAGISATSYEDLDLTIVSETSIGKGDRQLTETQKAIVAPIIEATQVRLGYRQQ